MQNKTHKANEASETGSESQHEDGKEGMGTDVKTKNKKGTKQTRAQNISGEMDQKIICFSWKDTSVLNV